MNLRNMHKAELSISCNPLMHLLTHHHRQQHSLTIQAMHNNKWLNLYNQLLPNQLLFSNGLMQTDTHSEEWTMEAQCGGMEQIGKSMPDSVYSWT